jgi:predicted enzyme related to lactoylglutathione lyase
VTVTETFFALEVRDMQRATRFYVEALGATAVFSSPVWSSLRIAGVRIGLFLQEGHVAGAVGLHFGVTDLLAACAAAEAAGGRTLSASTEVAPGIFIASVADTEGNAFTVRQA